MAKMIALLTGLQGVRTLDRRCPRRRRACYLLVNAGARQQERVPGCGGGQLLFTGSIRALELDVRSRDSARRRSRRSVCLDARRIPRSVGLAPSRALISQNFGSIA